MKKIFLASVLFIPLLSFGQYRYGFLQDFYFGRQPSARAEAMGKGYSSIDGDLAGIFFNPAGTATLNGAEINTSFASPYYEFENAQYSFLSAGYNFNGNLTVGFSRNHFTAGEEAIATDSDGNPVSSGHTPTRSLYSLNFSSKPIKNLLIGFNANYLSWRPGGATGSSFYFDAGAIKKFELAKNPTSSHDVSVGASITNLNLGKVQVDYRGVESEIDLPIITRYGLNYQFNLNTNWISDTLNTFRLIVQGDYQLLLNSDYHSGFRAGVELMFLEILALRMGYYEESQSDFGASVVNKDEISDITYGLGLQIPIHKLSQIPLNINFDYVSLSQTSYSKAQTNWGNFSTYTVSVNWLIER